MRKRLGRVVNWVLRPLDTRFIRQSYMDSLAAGDVALREELARTRDELRRARAVMKEAGLDRIAPEDSAVCVPLFHEMKIRPRPAGHVYTMVQALLERERPELEALARSLLPVMEGPELAAVPHEPTEALGPYWNNAYFSADDARAAYAMTATLKPRRIVEVGSGHSSRFFRKAINDHRLDTRLVSIDPNPRAVTDGISDEVITADVLDVGLDVFTSLGPGDFLFLDGSHLAFSGTDVTHSFLEILPRLPPGVVVHIHDIMLPFEYYPELAEYRRYNEQYLLGVLLLSSPSWKPILPVLYLNSIGVFKGGGCSFWIRRTE